MLTSIAGKRIVIIVIVIVKLSTVHHVSLVQSHQRLTVFINNVTDADSGRDFQQIRGDALEEASDAFSLKGLDGDVQDASVRWWMKHRPLRLQSCPEKVDGIYGRGTDGPGCGANNTGDEVAHVNVFFVASV